MSKITKDQHYIPKSLINNWQNDNKVVGIIGKDALGRFREEKDKAPAAIFKDKYTYEAFFSVNNSITREIINLNCTAILKVDTP